MHILLLETSSINAIIVVLGCPRRGYYSINCNIPCPEHCLSDCHIETGTCHGCKPGYQGDQCETGYVLICVYHAEVFSEKNIQRKKTR